VESPFQPSSDSPIPFIFPNIFLKFILSLKLLNIRRWRTRKCCSFFDRLKHWRTGDGALRLYNIENLYINSSKRRVILQQHLYFGTDRIKLVQKKPFWNEVRKIVFGK